MGGVGDSYDSPQAKLLFPIGFDWELDGLSINLPRLYLPGVDQTESLSLPKDYKQNNNIDLKINIS